MEYITLSANGIKGHMYGNRDSVVRTKELDNVNNITGRFGQQSAYGEIYSNCGASPYQEALNMESQEHRQREGLRMPSMLIKQENLLVFKSLNY